MIDIDAIRARAEAATPGPWEWNTERFKGGWSGITGKDNAEILFPNHCNDGDDGYAWFEDFPNDADAAFIAHAREDIPALLAEVDRLTAENERIPRIMDIVEKYEKEVVPDYEKLIAALPARAEQAEADAELAEKGGEG